MTRQMTHTQALHILKIAKKTLSDAYIQTYLYVTEKKAIQYLEVFTSMTSNQAVDI